MVNSPILFESSRTLKILKFTRMRRLEYVVNF